MKKKLIVAFSVFIITPVVIAIAVYLGLSFYYADTYMCGVFINGVYATGKSPEEMNRCLLDRTEAGEFTIVGRDGVSAVISLSDVNYTCDYLPELERMQKNQNPFVWIESYLSEIVDYTIYPDCTFDEERFETAVSQVSFLAGSGKNTDAVVEIVKTPTGYILHDETKEIMDVEKARKVISKAVGEGQKTVDLEKEDCYPKTVPTGEMKETYELWDKVSKFQSCEIKYHFHDGEEIVGAGIVSEWLQKDEEDNFLIGKEGDLVLDEEKLKEFVDVMAGRHDTIEKERTFHATRGDLVTVPAGTYGYKLDKKAEISYLRDAVARNAKEDREPVYLQKAWGEGENDIGNTYIEVDLTNQTLYYYQEGQLMMQAPVVTGNISKHNGTPEKACYVYFKQRNRILRGEDYATPVKYWIAVYGHIGIHDASWRGTFGGTIYRTKGSHGCINTPTNEVSQLYDMVEVGTPVMIFY